MKRITRRPTHFEMSELLNLTPHILYGTSDNTFYGKKATDFNCRTFHITTVKTAVDHNRFQERLFNISEITTHCMRNRNNKRDLTTSHRKNTQLKRSLYDNSTGGKNSKYAPFIMPKKGYRHIITIT